MEQYFFRETSFNSEYLVTLDVKNQKNISSNNQCSDGLYAKSVDNKNTSQISKQAIRKLTIPNDNTKFLNSENFKVVNNIFLTDIEAIDKAISKLGLNRKNSDGVLIKWSVDTSDIFLSNGEINNSVALIATLSKNEITKVKKFKFNIEKPSSQEIVNNIYDNLKFESISSTNMNSDYITSDLNLPDIGEHNSLITWSSSHPNIISSNGSVVRPSFNEESKTVTLTATINNNGVETTKEFYVTVIPDDSDIRDKN